jgi:hypothetical protein
VDAVLAGGVMEEHVGCSSQLASPSIPLGCVPISTS